MTATTTPDQRAAALASTQHGVLTYEQAIKCGLSARQIEHRVTTGTWRRLSRGVFVIAGTPEGPAQRTMAAYLSVARAGGVLSHTTAATMKRLMPHPPWPHVIVPRGLRTKSPLAVVHASDVPRIDQCPIGGMRATNVSRTLVDLAAHLDPAALETVVDDAFVRRLASPQSVGRVLDRLGDHRQGRSALRAVVDVWGEAIVAGSVAEMRLARLLTEWGFGDYVLQYEVYDDNGLFVARLDVAWPDDRCAFEYDTRQWHNPRRFTRDEARTGDVRSLGWRTRSATKADLIPGETDLRDTLRRWLGARAA